MTVKPIGERILVELKASEEKTSGGLVIPQTVQEKTQEGVIVAVGDSKDIKVAPGDSIIFDKYAGSQIMLNNREHLIIKHEDILAIIK